MASQLRKVILASSVPLALAATPAARWGHQAVYVPSKQAVYIIGGEVVSSGAQVTNDVLVLSLNDTSPSFTPGPSGALPPHAFAAATLSEDGESIVVLGGMTSTCSSDALAHTLDLSSTTWNHATPNGVARRRGAQAAWVDNGQTEGAVMLIGGVADTYVCSSATYTYPASDVLSLPLDSSALTSTRNLPTTLTGSELAISDFALTRTSDGSLYMVGGQSATGEAVSLDTIGKWTTDGGWVSQSTSGDVPAGRVGASLVVHPSLDLLVMHGGATGDGSPSSSTSLVAFLNTTTWAWSTPPNLQPPASSAASYHSSVMTSSGVMITAFGLGSSGSPRSDVYYLDMRDPAGSTWSWKSYWKTDMLEAYNAPTDSTAGIVTNDTASSSDSKKTASIVVPVLIGALILLPILFLFIRRKVRLARKRRGARHFSFSSQEDNGDFTSPLNHHSPFRTTKIDYQFGRDANEKEGGVLSDMFGALKRISTRSSGSSVEIGQVQRGQRVRRLNEKTMNWEEIDFGLGKLDQRARDGVPRSRNSSFSDSPPLRGIASTMLDPFSDEGAPVPLVHVATDSPRFGTPLHDGQGPLLPPLHVSPPTVPPTPAAQDPFNPSAQDGLDWSMLAQELTSRPAFRSISPSSTLRSHAHGPAPVASAPALRTPSPGIPSRSSTPPRLPPMSFPASSITLVNLKTGRRTSESLPFSAAPRVVSQPLAKRQLAGQAGRRGSAPFFTPSPTSSGTTTPPGDISYDAPMRRASIPAILTPGSPMGDRRTSTQSRLRVVNVTEPEMDRTDVDGGELSEWTM